MSRTRQVAVDWQTQMLRLAGQAEVIRSNQKDEYYQSYIRTSLAELVQSLGGTGLWVRWRKELDVLSDLGYFLLTTLGGFQTLGEEYVNIVQVDPTHRAVPSKLRRALLILLHTSAPYLLDQALKTAQRQLQQNVDLRLQPEVRARLMEAIPIVRNLVTMLHRCHLVVFYMHGFYYHIAKRLTSIKYLMVRPPTGESTSYNKYSVLGWLFIAQMTLTLIQNLRKLYLRQKSQTGDDDSSMMGYHETDRSNSEEFGDQEYASAERKCSLCLEARKQSTVTPCGHLFCWSCIMEWASSKLQCPLCRDKFEMSRLVRLQHYDPV